MGFESDAAGKFEKKAIKKHWALRAADFVQKNFGTVTAAREAGEYRQDLFPEIPADEELVLRLKGKCVVDLGSGLTHLRESSLINRIAQLNDPDTLFIGVDPNVGGVRGWKFLDLINRGLQRELRRSNPADLPGKKYAIRGEVPSVVLPEKSVDYFVSNRAIGLWERDPGKLLEIFQFMEEALKDSGEIRIGGTVDTLFTQTKELRDFINEHFTMSGEGPLLLVFRRKQKEPAA